MYMYDMYDLQLDNIHYKHQFQYYTWWWLLILSCVLWRIWCWPLIFFKFKVNTLHIVISIDTKSQFVQTNEVSFFGTAAVSWEYAAEFLNFSMGGGDGKSQLKRLADLTCFRLAGWLWKLSAFIWVVTTLLVEVCDDRFSIFAS